jgi:excisionase family DNA binding protein
MAVKRPDYCPHPDFEPGCAGCSLVNYGRDCRDNPIHRYLTVSEYAKLKRVSVRVVRGEIKKGRISAEKIGKEYRIPI